MIALLLFALIAGASAAPHYHFGHAGGVSRRPGSFHPFQRPFRPYSDENMCDAGRFWACLSKELRELDDMLSNFARHFPISVSQEGVQGTEYKITISLPDFEEKDIAVKAREGLLMIQANHKYDHGSEKNYQDARILPDTVNVTGTWIFEQGVLMITFPLKETVKVPESTEATETSMEQFGTKRQPTFASSREEIETNVNDVSQDADVGLARGDLDKESKPKTSEIPNRNTVEATTHTVDLKDEVELVPVRY